MALFILACEGCDREVLAKIDLVSSEISEPLPEDTMYAFDRFSNADRLKWALLCYCGGAFVVWHPMKGDPRYA